jgi:AraC family transcriptional regulator, ethanolamine operon transcriptional activator
VPTLKSTIAFDSYVDTIREATLLFIKTGPSRAPWGIEWHPFSRMSLQLGSDGGARVVHGISRGDAITFMFYFGKTPHPVLFDGYALKWHEVAVLSPNAHFTFAARRPTRWFALTLPLGLIDDPSYLREAGVSFKSRNVAITLPEDAATKLMTVAKRARNRAKKDLIKQASDNAAVEAALLAVLSEALTSKGSKVRRPDRHQASLKLKMSKVLEYVRSRHSENVHIEEIAEAAGISSRALQRCFRTYLRMPPKEYLKFRRLNLVRRGLRLDPSPEGSKNPITRILANYGVTEFGRFAAEYRRVFHELPSVTFSRRHLSE